MRAWVTGRKHELRLVERPDPEPGEGQIRVRVVACGVCRTDLHVVDQDLPPRRPEVVPGHEIVGFVDALGPGADDYGWAVGDRAGIAWLRGTCGTCRFCVQGAENLCLTPEFTGWDADGGYAERAVVDAAYAYRIPTHMDAVSAAPLLCAGIIGFRALRRCAVEPGRSLGIWGYGASAHLAAQVAMRAWGCKVHVFTRAASARALALEHGCHTAQDSFDPTPEALDSAIMFAPAGELVPAALRCLDRGGRLACAGIHLSDIPPLVYATDLFQERELVSVTANTRADGHDFLALAAELELLPTTTAYPFERADQALADLASDRVRGAAVLVL